MVGDDGLLIVEDQRIIIDTSLLGFSRTRLEVS